MYPDTPHAADPEFEEQQPGVIGGDRKTDQDQWRKPVQDHFTPEQPIEEESQQKQVVECCKKGDRNRTDVSLGRTKKPVTGRLSRKITEQVMPHCHRHGILQSKDCGNADKHQGDRLSIHHFPKIRHLIFC